VFFSPTEKCVNMKVVCPKCKVVNNVAEERLGDSSPVCGKCRGKLVPAAPGYPVSVTEANFNQAVLQSTTPVLLDLWGPSCPPCRQLAPLLKELAKELVGQLKVAKLNVEEQAFAASRFQVRGIPTLVLFSRGKEIARTSGFQPLSQLKRFVAPAL
jgi:thioredoxin 2